MVSLKQAGITVPKINADKLAERELVATRRSKRLADLKATQKEKSKVSGMV